MIAALGWILDGVMLIGELIGGLSVAVVLWVLFLAIRWALRLVRAI